jgi:hypothetical protein
VKFQTSTRDSASSGGSTAHGAVAGRRSDSVSLDACSNFDWIIVRTERSVYELIVLSGKDGEVLVRGGHLFPVFRRARVAGSMMGSATVTLASIVVGLHLELVVDGKSFATSAIEAVSRHNLIGGRAA